jgi:hypothetical protein
MFVYVAKILILYKIKLQAGLHKDLYKPTMNMGKKNVLIIGAAGRDFHNFNTCYRDNILL